MFEILYLMKIGMIAGLVMGMAAMILNMINFTTLDLTKYMGGLLTGQPSGSINFAAGFGFHIIVSAILAVIYLQVIEIFNIRINLHNGLHAGIIHTCISGLMLPVLDRLNPCVAQGSIRALGYFAFNYGKTATITFAAVHLIYAVAVFTMLAR